MTKQQLKQAIISVVIGAITIALVDLLEGLLGIAQSWLAEGTGGAVAGTRYFVKSFLT